ncbi:hypothetical protein BaRGS_00022727 [Batillaria attramentaria]|uniref:Secreted protein n=1 Tax=Batillaria attramentaria TaxID=370345 RepID=A0ABD0KG67_9CAEN
MQPEHRRTRLWRIVFALVWPFSSGEVTSASGSVLSAAQQMRHVGYLGLTSIVETPSPTGTNPSDGVRRRQGSKSPSAKKTPGQSSKKRKTEATTASSASTPRPLANGVPDLLTSSESLTEKRAKSDPNKRRSRRTSQRENSGVRTAARNLCA